MANNLYQEAINAADQIKEAAESKVKQQLVEAMSPKIKQLIEKSLLGEELYEMGEVPSDSHESDDKENEDKLISPDDNDAEGNELQDDDKNNSSKEERGTMESEKDIARDAFYAGSNIQEVEISSESAGILKRMMNKSNKKNAISNKLQEINLGIKSLKKAIIIAEGSNKTQRFTKKFKLAYKNLLSELKKLESNSIIKTDKTLLKEYLRISKELKNMSKRRGSRKNYLNESLEDLLEMNIFEDDDEEIEDDDEDMTADEPSEEEPAEEELELDLDEPADAPAGSYDDLMDMPLSDVLDAALAGGSEDMSDPGDEEELELDLEDEVAEENEVIEFDESDEIPEMHESRRGKKDLFLEIDENMLKKEITKMKRLREGEASEMASHFGGGSLDKEMFVDVDEGDLNVHAGVLGREDVPMPKVEAALRKTMRKNRMLESKIRQFKNAVRGMKTQLSEMNLFNAKLLYANKLMQNRDLSIKQQKHIVESLDEAGTLNEAKLLFESLSKSLSKPARRGRNLSEGTNRRTLSSASRSTKSAQPINENVALDRWATLAGIKK